MWKIEGACTPSWNLIGIFTFFLGMGQHHQPGTCWTYYVKQYAGNLLNHAGHYLQLVFSMAKNEVPIYWRYLLYIRSMFQAYFSGNIPTIHMAWKMLRLRTSILSTWMGHWYLHIYIYPLYHIYRSINGPYICIYPWYTVVSGWCIH